MNHPKTITYQYTSLDYAEAFHQSLKAVAEERKYLLTVKVPELDLVREFVEKLIANKDAQFMALVGDQGEKQVAGWCDIRRRQRQTIEHVGELGMGVLKAFRGQGIGNKLLEMTMADAFAKGIERIELEVFASNTAAIKLYEKHGFEYEGRKRKARYLDGAYEDILMMARLA